MNDKVIRRLANMLKAMGVDNPVTVATCLYQWGALRQSFVDKLGNNVELEKVPKFTGFSVHELMPGYESVVDYQPVKRVDAMQELLDKLDKAIEAEDYRSAAKLKSAIDKLHRRKN